MTQIGKKKNKCGFRKKISRSEMERRFGCEHTRIVGGSKIFLVGIMFGCETHNKEKKNPVWHQDKFCLP